MFFEAYSWVPIWFTFFDTIVLEVYIAFKIRQFLGNMTSEQAKVLRWRLSTLGRLSTADKVKMEEE